ncbi:NADH-quinone oxidoreductase subunit M [Kluyvera cryocrescens]|uniref:NADH-quinone oxidoreductase subunit M n=1 Tax=Kluyvera cryocrescens TaxID=580 RepID=A0A485AYM2_KLUCR|nr:NADH-quinone oxidoreductase subunit M [Kluyvera cryocrescens]
MLLPWLILIPFIGGFLCWQTERFGVKMPRWIALITMGLDAGAVSATVVAGWLFADPIRGLAAVAV